LHAINPTSNLLRFHFLSCVSYRSAQSYNLIIEVNIDCRIPQIIFGSQSSTRFGPEPAIISSSADLTPQLFGLCRVALLILFVLLACQLTTFGGAGEFILNDHAFELRSTFCLAGYYNRIG